MGLKFFPDEWLAYADHFFGYRSEMIADWVGTSRA